MKKLALILVFWVAAVAATMGQSDTRSFDVKGFDKLSLGSAFKIKISQSDRFRVVASGDKQDLDDLVAKVSGGTLSIKYETNRNKRKSVELDIEMPALSALSLSGASSTVAKGFSGGSKLKLDVSGAAKLTLDISVGAVEFDLSGASSTTLTGKANSLRGDLSGASSLKAAGFPVKDAQVEASGASSASVKTSAKLLAEASGASSVRYSGGATDVRINTSGGSSVKKGE